MPTRLDHHDADLLRELKKHRDEAAEVKSAHAAAGGGGFFSRLRETFTGR